MTLFAANPASSADDQRDTLSTVEAPPADPPAANSSDPSDPADVIKDGHSLARIVLQCASTTTGNSRFHPVRRLAGRPCRAWNAAASPARGRLSVADISSLTTTPRPQHRSPTWLAAPVLARAPSSRPAYSALPLARSRASAPPAGPLQSDANPAPVPPCLTEPGPCDGPVHLSPIRARRLPAYAGGWR